MTTRPEQPHWQRRGLTLLELTVVMLGLALLALLIFTQLRSSQRLGHQALSTNNLRMLVAANHSFAADHGTFCPATDARNHLRWHGARTSSGAPFDPTRGSLSDYLGDGRRVIACPEFRRHLADSTSWELGSGGYGYNATYLGGTPENPFQPLAPARVLSPARTLMFATTALAKAEGLQEYPFAEPPHWVDPDWQLQGPLQPSVHFRFGGRALIAWCDGHVTSEPPGSITTTNYYGGSNKEYSIGFPGPVEDNGPWNPRR